MRKLAVVRLRASRGNRTGAMGKTKALPGIGNKEGLTGLADWSPLEDELQPRCLLFVLP
jgi:hypothetical protein